MKDGSMAMALESFERLFQEIRSGESAIKVNAHQCKFLSAQCVVVEEYVQLWRNQMIKPPRLAMEELLRVVQRALTLLQQCRDDNWLYHAAVRLNNSKAFAGICFQLSKLTALVNSQMILCSGDLTSREVQSLLSMPQKHKKFDFDDFQSATNALSPGLEADKVLLKVRFYEEIRNNELDPYLVEKLKTSAEGSFPAIEPLELKEMIGGGAFGTVFRAEWLGMPVAVKEFREGDSSFEKELKILKVLMLEPDPNVLQMIGYYVKDDRAYLVMELMETDLAKVIRKDHSSLRLIDLIDMMLQIARGMIYLHERNVVHRDLKPSNILVEMKKADSSTNSFNIRLTDFGFSKSNFVSFAPDLTYQRGTIYYMAPEMYRGQKYSREVDVYSFGVTCFQMLTATLPFFQNGERVMANKLVEMIEAGDRPDLPLDCPKELEVLINRCWNTNPKDRPNFESITRILSSLKDKLLIGHFRESKKVPCQSINDPQTADDLELAAADLIDKASVAAVSFNQCRFLQSKCMQISSFLHDWDDLSLPSKLTVMRKLVKALKSAQSLIESYRKEKWLQTAVMKLHNPRAFRMVVEELNWCANALMNSEAVKPKSDDAHRFVQNSPFMTLDRLEQYAEDDKRKMVESAKEIISASEDETSIKLAEYLVRKVDDGVPYIEPEQIVLQNFLGMSKRGTVFKASWLGLSVTLKNLKSGEKFLKDIESRRLENRIHPNLLSVVGYTKQGEQLFLVIEFANGGLLRDTNKPYPLPLAVEILFQLAQGIRYSHEYHLGHRNLEVTLVEFEKTESEGFTGNITVKLPTHSSSLKEESLHGIRKIKNQLLGPNELKKSDAYQFGATCFEIITGNAIEAEILLLRSEEVPQLPSGCPSSIQLLIEMCCSSRPPDFTTITETLQAARLEVEKTTTNIDYRKMLLEQSSRNNELQLVGNATVGSKLSVVGNLDRGTNRLYQWVREHRDGTIERLRPILVTGIDFETLDYVLTADDFDKAISLTYVDMNEKIEVAGRETTNSKWVSYSDSMNHAIKQAWEAGEARFKITMMQDSSSRKCYLVITRTHYRLVWKHYLKKMELKTAFSSAVCIRLSDEDPEVCHLINSSAKTCNIRFSDSYSRDLGVLTFRKFMRMNSLRKNRGSA